MPTYNILVTEYYRGSREYEFEIEADSEEEANEIAGDTYFDYDGEYCDEETDDVDISVSGGPDPDAGYDEFKEEQMLRREDDSCELGGE